MFWPLQLKKKGGAYRLGRKKYSYLFPDDCLCESEVKVKVAQLCLTLRTHGPYSPWNSPGQNTGVGSLSLLQGIFPTQGLDPGLPHCRRILYHLSHKGSPQTIICLCRISQRIYKNTPRTSKLNQYCCKMHESTTCLQIKNKLVKTKLKTKCHL